MDLVKLAASVTAAAEELIAAAQPKAGRVFVLGCSTSEILGSKIGTARSPETAEAVIRGVLTATRAHGLYLAVQCCEHLNRALIVEEEAMERLGLTQVTVHPVPEAGGSAASCAYDLFAQPVVVERVTADLGMDIGQTLIGMHLKRVAVPVRLQVKSIGEAVLTAARTRPPLIGGERAKYF
ncbi:MAG: TIGR01440 family protein [Acidaminococcaceae bacterium]|nr:TIGR01440 family protein [Acidaminococcaceae bacterium]